MGSFLRAIGHMRNLLLLVVILAASGCATGKVPTDRSSSCQDYGRSPVDGSSGREVKSLYSVEIPDGKWCLSTTASANDEHNFGFVSGPILERKYPTGTVPQQEIAHMFRLLGHTRTVDDPSEISTAEGIKAFMAQEEGLKKFLSESSAKYSARVDLDTVPGASCIWIEASVNFKQPTWTSMWTHETLICRHPDREDTLVGIVFQEHRRKGWRDPNPALTRKYRDAAIASLRSLRFGMPKHQYPQDAFQITSDFGSRYNTIGKKRNAPHSGIDILAPEGTPVLAIADGVVFRSRLNRKFGEEIKIKHAVGTQDEIRAQYTHLDARLVKVGEKVRRGQIIGTVGKTGSSEMLTSDVAHLHMALWSTSLRGDGGRCCENEDPHEFWYDGRDTVTVYRPGKDYSDYPYRFTYPVPGKDNLDHFRKKLADLN